VETKADGTGVVVPAQSITAGSLITAYAIQRSATSNFVGNVAAPWSLSAMNGGVVAGDLVPAGDSKSATFTGHAAGTTKIRVTSAGLSSVDSGLLTVVGGTATQVRVETAADGSGTVVPAQNVVAARSVKMYAIRRDTYGNFVDNVAASAWTLPSITGGVVSTDLIPASDAKSATFIGNQTGTATVRATSGALATVDSGVLNVVPATVASVVISQIYGGGGNASATYQSDFVELFNRTANPVNMSGWSIQYASSTGSSFANVVPLTNANSTIPAYSYYLIKLAAGTNVAADFSADITNTTVNAGAGGGKVALANTTTALGVVSLPDSRVIDFVGYAANQFEGTGSAPGPSDNASSVIRNSGGCSDTDNNAGDFTLGVPSPRTTANSSSACPPNPPTVSSIANQSIDANTSVGPLTFTVNDAETAATSLIVTTTSDNQTLLPNANISVGGSGIVRNITLHPVSGQTGTALVTITVKDTDNMTATSSFNLFVGGGPALGIVFSENFDEYADGTSLSFANNSPWFHTSGTNYELIVSNYAAQVSLYLTNSEDINASLAGGPFTVASGTVLYVGFTLNQTSLPGANGDYFIHLRDVSGTNFAAKVFASTGNAASGKFRLGVSNRANTPPNVQFPLDLSLNTTYRVVVRYKIGVASSTIWVNPASPNDVGATATDTSTPFDVSGIGIRESGTPTTPTTAGSQAIDNIIVSSAFSDVTTFPPSAPSLTATISGNALQITWPTNNNSGFVLQTAGTVNALTWNAVNGVSVSGANYTVTVPFTASPAYFRLKQ
ncbi:MAG: lamin tail domain-containing protein, partial [Limisphaerales bacterium]